MPAFPPRRGRSVIVAVLLHALAVGPWVVSTARFDSRPIGPVEPRGVMFVMTPTRGLGSPPPAAPPEPARAAPLVSGAAAAPGSLTEPIRAEVPTVVPVSIPVDLPPPAVTPAPGADAGHTIPARAESSEIGQTAGADDRLPPALGTPGGQSNWAGLVLGRLQQFKRYPAEARQRREEGVCHVRVTIDRQGRVRDASLIRSSGHPRLDRESLALARRADPLPPPPPEVEGETISLTVPVEFFLVR